MEKRIELCDEELCCGCGACANICSRGCIQMIENAEGFLIPQIDNEKCVKCGVCVQHCPIGRSKKNENTYEKKCFGAISKSDADRFKSSSGGVFKQLASQWLNDGGTVFGVRMSDDLSSAIFQEVTDESGLDDILGSKYIQANTEFVYKRVEELLQSGGKVLFSGVPCQINALKAFLGKEYSNLLCVDVICHGVPSPAVWRKYLATLREKYSSVKGVCFRYKKYGWENFGLNVKLQNKKVKYESKDINPYMQLFLNDICLRKSCYKCQFKGYERSSDITIGDFWGSKDYVPQLTDGKGTSIVLIHSHEGMCIWSKIEYALLFQEVDYQEVFKEHNRAMMESPQMPDNRKDFFEDLKILPFKRLQSKYITLSKKEKTKLFLEKCGVLYTIRRLRKRGGGALNTALQ